MCTYHLWFILFISEVPLWGMAVSKCESPSKFYNLMRNSSIKSTFLSLKGSNLQGGKTGLNCISVVFCFLPFNQQRENTAQYLCVECKYSEVTQPFFFMWCPAGNLYFLPLANLPRYWGARDKAHLSVCTCKAAAVIRLTLGFHCKTSNEGYLKGRWCEGFTTLFFSFDKINCKSVKLHALQWLQKIFCFLGI